MLSNAPERSFQITYHKYMHECDIAFMVSNGIRSYIRLLIILRARRHPVFMIRQQLYRYRSGVLPIGAVN
jgi:hypothetical protein